MANGLKYSITTETETLRKGNFWLAVGDVQKPFGTYYTAIVPPSGGYSIYQNKPSDGPAIYVANSDAELIQYTKLIMGTTFATGPSALNWYNTQTDKMVTNIEYPQISTNGLVLNLDAGFTPSFPKGGTTWYDLGASGNNGSLINGPTFSTATGGSIVFDGSDDYVALGNYSFGITRDFTISFWMDMTKTGSMQIFNKGYNSPWGIYIDKQSTNLLSCQLSYDSGSSAQINSANNNNFSGIKNWTVVRNNTQLIWYLNGVQNSTAATTSDNISQSSLKTWAIGENLENIPGLANFQGSIFTQQVYNRALSRTEITQNYQAFLPRFLGQNIVTSGMVQYLNAGYSNSYPGSGTTWTNVAGVSGGNGTLTNGPTYSSANGGSIVFDGTDDYVNLGTQSLISTDFTINLWFRSSINSLKEHFILSLGYSSFSSLVIAMDTQNNGTSSIYTYYRDAAGVVTGRGALNSVFPSLAIVNFSLVRKNGVNTPYLNGIPQTLRIFTENVTLGALNYVLGYAIPRNKTSAYMQGNIYSSSIYNIGLNSSEILQNYQASLPQVLAENIVTNGMVAYYDAGYFTSYPATGSSWYDVAGVLAATGALTNGPTFSSSNGGVIILDGIDDRINAPSSSVYDFTNNSSFTLETFCYATTQSSSGMIPLIERYSTATGFGGYALRLRNYTTNYPEFVVVGTPSGSTVLVSSVRGTTQWVSNTWYHIVGTKSTDGVMKIYVNGVLEGTTTGVTNIPLPQTGVTLKIGSRGDTNDQYSNQRFSICRIYNRALTPSEVLQNYNAQKSRFGL